MIEFKDVDFLNLLFNIATLIVLAELHNKSSALMRLIKKKSRAADQIYPSSQYIFEEIDPGIYKIIPRPPAYMYLEDLPAVEWISVDNSALTLKTNKLMCNEICLILNSATPIEAHQSGLAD